MLERLTPGDLVVHIDHGVARYEQMLRRGGAGRGPRLPRAVVRRRRPDLRPGRADRPGHPLRRRRAAGALQARRHGMAARQAAGPQGGRRPRRRAARAVRRPRRARRASRSRPTRRGRREMEAAFPYEETVDQLRATAEVKADMEQQPADGPARRRRRRLRQDRGGAARRVQGDPGRQAGRGPRPDDGPRRPAPRDVQPAVRGVPARGPAAVAVRVGEGAGGDARRASRTGPSTSSSGRTGCSRRTSGSRTSGSSSSTRSSGSGSPPRSGSSSSAARWTC